MKKFTFMLIAAFVAVASWAGVPVKKATALQPQNVVQLDAQKKAPKLVKAAAPFKVMTPVTNRFAAKAKANVRRAPMKAGIADLLTADLMLVSDYYEVVEGGIDPGMPAAGGWAVSVSLTGTNTLAIEGFTSDATETIVATFEETTDPELQAEGVIATATIEAGQTLFESSYGPVLLDNALEDAPLTAYVLYDGTIFIDGLWYDVLGGDGQYAGYMWSGYLYSSAVVAANGTMDFVDYQGEKYSEIVYIYQDEDNPKTVSVYNFAGEEAAVDVTMKSDGSFVIDEQPLFYYNSQYEYIYTTGIIVSGGYSLNSLTGVSKGNTLNFDGNWGIYSKTAMQLFGVYDPAVITRTDGVDFVLPTAVAGPATPADPEIRGVGNYDDSQGYGSVAFNVPTEDIDGNELNVDDLYYQLFARIDGKEEPIVFTPEICEMLTEDMTIIPYTFTDNWDFQDRGYKVVFLNYNFNLTYEAIGVQSIYTGGGVENRSAIVWADVEKVEPPVTGGEYTFNFNKMDVPVSATGVEAGDIKEDFTIKEGNVSLTISPSTTDTPNRFWSTSAGPQLRVYSGTLTFEVPEGSTITQIVFNHNGRWGEENSADSGKITNDADAKAATWTGEAQMVVVTIAANSQINSIVVTVGGGGSQPVEDVLVELPSDVTPQEYSLVTEGATSQGMISYKDTRYVAFDGSDVYLQGLAYYFPDAYVKGTLDGNQIVVKSGQFVGEDEYGKEYLVGLGVDEDDYFFYSPQIVFDYDKESGVISLAEGTYYGESETSDDMSLWDYFESAVYTPGAYEAPTGIEVPADLTTEVYMLTGFDTYFEEDVQREVEVGFYGTDEVYFKNLSEYTDDDNWVKGTIANGVVTIPETFLGIYSSLFGDADIFFPETEFTYDSEADKFICKAGFTTFDSDGYAWDELEDVVLTRVIEMEATPADPSVTELKLYAVDDDGNVTEEFVTYPYVQFNIPTVDVDGNPMLLSKLSYQIYIIDANDEQKVLTLTTDLYTEIEADMTEIPYNYTDDWDIYAGGRVYLNQDPKEIASWKNIGVQSIYRGLGEENLSNIGWLYEIPTSITDINAATDNATVYFDLQGRRVEKLGKGLYISNGKKVVRK